MSLAHSHLNVPSMCTSLIRSFFIMPLNSYIMLINSCSKPSDSIYIKYSRSADSFIDTHFSSGSASIGAFPAAISLWTSHLVLKLVVRWRLIDCDSFPSPSSDRFRLEGALSISKSDQRGPNIYVERAPAILWNFRTGLSFTGKY